VLEEVCLDLLIFWYLILVFMLQSVFVNDLGNLLVSKSAISKFGKPASSVSIMSGYGLDDRAIDDRSPAEAK
jgi:hypothetical protein